jgi:hypothetical protein
MPVVGVPDDGVAFVEVSVEVWGSVSRDDKERWYVGRPGLLSGMYTGRDEVSGITEISEGVSSTDTSTIKTSWRMGGQYEETKTINLIHFIYGDICSTSGTLLLDDLFRSYLPL